MYCAWSSSNGMQPFSRLNFYTVVLDNKLFTTVKHNGYDCFKFNGCIIREQKQNKDVF